MQTNMPYNPAHKAYVMWKVLLKEIKGELSLTSSSLAFRFIGSAEDEISLPLHTIEGGLSIFFFLSSAIDTKKVRYKNP